MHSREDNKDYCNVKVVGLVHVVECGVRLTFVRFVRLNIQFENLIKEPAHLFICSVKYGKVLLRRRFSNQQI